VLQEVVYTGAVPNQQLQILSLIIKTLAREKFFIVGRTTLPARDGRRYRRSSIEKNGGSGSPTNISSSPFGMGIHVNKIRDPAATSCCRTFVGDSVVAFYREYKTRLTQRQIADLRDVTSEIEIAEMGRNTRSVSSSSFPYFQAIDTDRNKASSERYRALSRSGR